MDEEEEFKDSSPEASPRHGGSARLHVRPLACTFSLGSGTLLPVCCGAESMLWSEKSVDCAVLMR